MKTETQTNAGLALNCKLSQPMSADNFTGVTQPWSNAAAR